MSGRTWYPDRRLPSFSGNLRHLAIGDDLSSAPLAGNGRTSLKPGAPLCLHRKQFIPPHSAPPRQQLKAFSTALKTQLMPRSQ